MVTACLTLITSHWAKVKIYTHTLWVRRALVWSSSALGKLTLQVTYTYRCNAGVFTNQSTLFVQPITYKDSKAEQGCRVWVCLLVCIEFYRTEKHTRPRFTCLSSPAHSSRGSGSLEQAHGCTMPPQDHCRRSWSLLGWLWTLWSRRRVWHRERQEMKVPLFWMWLSRDKERQKG